MKPASPPPGRSSSSSRYPSRSRPFGFAQDGPNSRRLRIEALEERRLLDGIAPTVTGTTPSLSGGYLDAGTAILTIQFSEPVIGGGIAANYRLQSLGPDALLGSADDVILPVSVSYAGTAATLSFPMLTENVYRVTVRDAIADADGNALDGDANGTAGGDWFRDSAVTPADGGLFAGASYPTGSHANPQSIVAADFSGDGIADLVTANASSDNVTLAFADGCGGGLVHRCDAG